MFLLSSPLVSYTAHSTAQHSTARHERKRERKKKGWKGREGKGGGRLLRFHNQESPLSYTLQSINQSKKKYFVVLENWNWNWNWNENENEWRIKYPCIINSTSIPPPPFLERKGGFFFFFGNSRIPYDTYKKRNFFIGFSLAMLFLWNNNRCEHCEQKGAGWAHFLEIGGKNCRIIKKPLPPPFPP